MQRHRMFSLKASLISHLKPLHFALVVLTGCVCLSSQAKLPDLGNSYSITEDQEADIGRAWLSLLKGGGNLLNDPQVTSYIESLTNRLTSVSQLKTPNVNTLVLNNTVFNGFAIPGGVIGLNAGLIRAAHNEGELASVIAHELAHLSQRHYAERLEQQSKNTPYLIAATIGSILLASQDAEAGSAAISSTLAANMQSTISFTRKNEQEADAIGIQTLVNAGFSANDMAMMFNRLLMQSRFQNAGLEFLRTHPLSESRVAAARSRASKYSSPNPSSSLDFLLVKARIETRYVSNTQQYIQQAKQRLASPKLSQDQRFPVQYGLVLAYMTAKQLKKARELIDTLAPPQQSTVAYLLLNAELALLEKNFQLAENISGEILSVIPQHYAASVFLSKALLQQERANEAAQVLAKIAHQRPLDSLIWYELSEAYGLAKNIDQVHISRAQYFIATGQPERALQQIKFGRTQNNDSNKHQIFEELTAKAKELQRLIKDATGS